MKTVEDLIKILQKLPPTLPIATHANNHTYMSGNDDGSLKVALLKTYGGDHIIIGNFYKRNLNKPNWYITEVFEGEKEINLYESI
jgi:hypothetical protein